MKWKTLRRFYISQIRLPGDFIHSVRNSEHVARIAESIKATGFVRPPVVRVQERARFIVCGQDTVAALALLGIPEFIGAALECTPEEAFASALADNTVRKELSVEEAEERARSLLNLSAFSTKTRAREDAAELGIMATVGLKGRYKPSCSQELEVSLELKDLGMELEEEWLSGVRKTHREMVALGLHLEHALSVVGKLRGMVGDGLLDRWARELQVFAADVRDNLPYGICPYCKGLPVIGCGPCSGKRWVPRLTFEGAPAKLKDTRDKVIVDEHGNAVRVRDYR